MFACTRQAGKELVVRMGQKKGSNLLVILSDLLQQRQQLTNQGQHQTRLGTDGDRVSLQLWLLQLLDDVQSSLAGLGMLGLLEHLVDLLNRSCCRLLRSGVGLQEQQRAWLVQFAKKIQDHRIIRFETGSELIDQACLHLDQGILIAREQFQFGHWLAIWSQPVQIGQVGTAGLGQQIRINQVGLGTRCASGPIHCARIDGIDWPARFQQGGNQQPMASFNNASHLLFGCRSKELLQEGVELGEPLCIVTDPKRSHLAPFLIKDQGVVVVVGPINADILHTKRSSLKNTVPEHTCPYTVALQARLSHDRSGSGTTSGKRELSESVEPGGEPSLSPTRSTVVENKCLLVPALCREGLLLV